MAIAFASASTQYLGDGTAPVTAVPLSMACWVYMASLATARCWMNVGVAGSGDNFFELGCNTGDQVTMTTRSTGNAIATHASTFSSGVWFHAAGVTSAANARTAYLNGSGTNNTTSATPTGVTDLRIARRLSGIRYHDGRLAECAIWNVALTAADITMLSLGLCPLYVRPDALVYYAPLHDRATPSIDLIGRRELAWNNTPTVADHPPIIRRFGKRIIIPAAAAPAAGDLLLRLMGEGLFVR